MRLESGARSHIGLNADRQNNEDSYLVRDERGLYAVADGLGGHAAGEVASAIAVGVVDRAMFDGPGVGSSLWWDEVFAAAHDTILREGRRSNNYGMGTTLTAAVVAGARLNVAHAGDSACFLVRAGHTFRLTERQSRGHRLDNCLGVSRWSFQGAQHAQIELQVGDVIVLASDGFTDYLPTTQQLTTLVRPTETAGMIAVQLVAHALAGGGHDNVTVVCVKVVDSTTSVVE